MCVNMRLCAVMFAFEYCLSRIAYFRTVLDRKSKSHRDPKHLWCTARALVLDKVRACKWQHIKDFRQDVRRYIACYNHKRAHPTNSKAFTTVSVPTASIASSSVGTTGVEASTAASTAPSFMSPLPRARGSFVAATPTARTAWASATGADPDPITTAMGVIEQRRSSFHIMLIRELAEHEARVFPLLCRIFPDRFAQLATPASSSLLSKTGSAIASFASYVGLTPKTPKRSDSGADSVPPPTPPFPFFAHELESPWKKFKPYRPELDGGAGSREDWQLFYSHEGRTVGTRFASLSGFTSRPRVALPLDPHECWREWQRQSLVVFEHALPPIAEGDDCTICTKPRQGLSFDVFPCGHGACAACKAKVPQCRQCRTVRDALSFQVGQASILVQRVTSSCHSAMSSRTTESPEEVRTTRALTGGETVLPMCCISFTKLRVHGRIRPHASDLSFRIQQIWVRDERLYASPFAASVVTAAVSAASASAPAQEPAWLARPHPFSVVLGLRGQAGPDLHDQAVGNRQRILDDRDIKIMLEAWLLPPDQTLDSREEDGVPDLFSCSVTRSMGCQDPSPALHRTRSTGARSVHNLIVDSQLPPTPLILFKHDL
jgi:hypothetical protein